jgi:uncharacterized protein with HEPN domain
VSAVPAGLRVFGQALANYAAAGEDNFKSDLKTQDAIIRNFQVLGEAVKNVSAETRAAHPAVPWKDIAGMRDRVVHDYFGVSLSTCGT